jgi:cytidylate kinase
MTDAIRREDVSAVASRIAVHPGVRKCPARCSVPGVRRPAGSRRATWDRCIPDACLKVYLTAIVAARSNGAISS